MTLSAEQRAAISRSHSKKSTGPRTAEGKARSRGNALKHGLRAEALPMPGEDPEFAAQRSRRWRDYYRPQSPAAEQLLDDCVRASLLSERVAAFQVAAAEAQLERACDEHRDAPGSGHLTESEASSHLAAAAALCLIPDDVNLARLYLRYQAEARTSFLRSWAALEAVLRSDAAAGRPEAEDGETPNEPDSPGVDGSPNEPDSRGGRGPVVETTAHHVRGPKTDPSRAEAVPPNEPPCASLGTSGPMKVGDMERLADGSRGLSKQARPVAALSPNEPGSAGVAPPNEPRRVAVAPRNEAKGVAVAPPNEPRRVAVAPPNEAKGVAAGSPNRASGSGRHETGVSFIPVRATPTVGTMAATGRA